MSAAHLPMTEDIGVEWTGRDSRGKPIRVAIAGDRIAAVVDCPPSTVAPDERLIPGLLDLQVNGWGGVDFGADTLTIDQVRMVVRRLQWDGVTQFLPTLTTAAPARLETALRNLATAALEPDLRPALPGFHLEGPFISPEDGPRGAHPLEHCRPPDWALFERWQAAAGGNIRLLTLAPELPGACEFIQKAVATGVRVAIGHTAARRPEILAAIAAGATLATHLGNAAHDRLQRHHNYVYDLLGDDRIAASLILDGHHLPPHLAKIFIRAKGIDRIVLISDAVKHAGMRPGIYEGFGQQVEVRADGFVGVVGQPRLAGSGLALRLGVENAMRFADVDLAAAIDAATIQPARLMGWDRELGRLAPGCMANIVRIRFDETARRIEILDTMAAGIARSRG